MYGDGVSARIAQSSLNFKYEELRKATNYFDPANKLGQGSNGAVYKVYIYSYLIYLKSWIDLLQK